MAMIIQTYDDLEALSRAAAELFARRAEAAVKDRDRFSVALSGGGTPRRAYELLARPPLKDLVPWEKTHVFWGDERCVPFADPRSNARLAREALLAHVPLPPAQVHPISCLPSPFAAAANYEALLRDFFGHGPPRLDLVLLGLGPDGHTASLFSFDPVVQAFAKNYSLISPLPPGGERVRVRGGAANPLGNENQEEERWTAAVFSQELPRVTLTPALINRAGAVVFLVAGADKAEVLREVLKGPRDPLRLPAQLIKPVDGELYWLVDRAAAAVLG